MSFLGTIFLKNDDCDLNQKVKYLANFGKPQFASLKETIFRTRAAKWSGI